MLSEWYEDTKKTHVLARAEPAGTHCLTLMAPDSEKDQ